MEEQKRIDIINLEMEVLELQKAQLEVQLEINKKQSIIDNKRKELK